MPAIKCPNGKWKWGENGKCIHPTKEKAELIGRAIALDQARQDSKEARNRMLKRSQEAYKEGEE